MDLTHPRAWRRYIQACNGKSPEPGLARFAARFHLAKAFDGVTLQGFAQQTEQAYSAAIRAALSYSAVEALDSALGRRTGQDSLVDAHLAEVYRSRGCQALRKQLESLTQSQAVQRKLVHLATDEGHDDVMPVAAALRHLVFHGDFTAHGGRAAPTKVARDFMDELASALLDHADDGLQLYLDREAIGPWSIRRRRLCPSCGVDIGKKHGPGCEIAVCKSHGERRAECFGEGSHSATTYWGVYPGTLEALNRGWVYERSDREEPDINRVIVELTWDSRTEQYV